MKGAYQTARKLLAAGAKHVGGYRWSIPGDMQYGAKVIAEKVGGTVRQVSPDKDRAGFVVVEITDPLAQALERKGIMNARNACGVARNGESEQREIVEMNIDSLKKDLDKVVRGLDETKRWMGKYGDNRIASIDKAKGAVVQAIQQLKY
jgi:hypothetical protein